MHRILLVMMPRFRSRMALRPINRIKHVFDAQGATTAGTAFKRTLILTVDAPVLANTNECETGSTVNGIYLRVEVVNTGTAGVLANAYMTVAKNPGNNVTIPDANVIGASDNKRFVIHQEMVMLQMVDNSNPRTLFNGVIAIPKGYRRNAPADRLEIAVFSPGIELNICIQCHYKEFR